MLMVDLDACLSFVFFNPMELTTVVSDNDNTRSSAIIAFMFLCFVGFCVFFVIFIYLELITSVSSGFSRETHPHLLHTSKQAREVDVTGHMEDFAT